MRRRMLIFGMPEMPKLAPGTPVWFRGTAGFTQRVIRSLGPQWITLDQERRAVYFSRETGSTRDYGDGQRKLFTDEQRAWTEQAEALMDRIDAAVKMLQLDVHSAGFSPVLSMQQAELLADTLEKMIEMSKVTAAPSSE